jgi:phosphohistidine phosphatase
MLRLLLLRHAKAAPPDGLEDRERPLTGTGREASLRVGAFLARERLVPDLALVSPAQRTQETWSIARRGLDDVPTRGEPRIYEAAVEPLLALVKETGPYVATLLLVGHNPGMQELLRLLICDEERYAHGRVIAQYPPASLALVALPAGAWRDVAPRSGHLERFVTPQSLGLQDGD